MESEITILNVFLKVEISSTAKSGEGERSNKNLEVKSILIEH